MSRRTSVFAGKPAASDRTEYDKQALTASAKGREREETLAAGAIRRKRQAFVRLYDRFVDKIYRCVYYEVGDATQAEDLTGRVFLKAWEAIGDYKWTARPFVAWLYHLAHEVVVDHLRTRGCSSSDAPTAVGYASAKGTEPVWEPMAPETLCGALRQLKQDQQRVIILRFLEGYDTSQVAEIMGKPPREIRSLQYHALTRLNAVFLRGADAHGNGLKAGGESAEGRADSSRGR